MRGILAYPGPPAKVDSVMHRRGRRRRRNLRRRLLVVAGTSSGRRRRADRGLLEQEHGARASAPAEDRILEAAGVAPAGVSEAPDALLGGGARVGVVRSEE